MEVVTPPSHLQKSKGQNGMGGKVSVNLMGYGSVGESAAARDVAEDEEGGEGDAAAAAHELFCVCDMGCGKVLRPPYELPMKVANPLTNFERIRRYCPGCVAKWSVRMVPDVDYWTSRREALIKDIEGDDERRRRRRGIGGGGDKTKGGG